MSVISKTNQKLICIPMSSLRPWHAVCMMKMTTDHVGVMWVSSVCNFKVSPFMVVASTYVHIRWDVREAIGHTKLMG